MIPDTRNRGGVVTLGVKRATQVNLSFLYNKGFSKLEKPNCGWRLKQGIFENGIGN